MIRLNVHAAKTHLSRHLAELEPGDVIVLCRHNVPIAELRALPRQPKAPRPIGLAKGRFAVPRSFFDALPDDTLADFEADS